MKIITKTKDYYDYLVSYYGYDETRVYDRRNDHKDLPYNYPGKCGNFGNNGRYLLSICDVYYPIVETNGVLIFDKKDLVKKDYTDQILMSFKGRPSKENAKYRTPVLLCNTYSGESEAFIPTLSTYGIPSIISANDMYEMIYNYLGWLVDNPAPPDNQTNKDKIVSHGFDLKSSFRPLIKN